MTLKAIDLTVLFVDTIPARIYLAFLIKKGFKPKKVIYLDIRPESKKYKFVEQLIGSYFAGGLLNTFKKIKSLKNNVVSVLGEKLLRLHELSKEDLSSCLDVYKDQEICKLVVNGLNDKKLASCLTPELGETNTILFTGGGILKEVLLDVNNIKFIHIHPGIVPEIRGADCIYWSLLLRGKAGYSAFYMNKGIDTGDIITTKEFDVNLSTIDIENYSNDELYHSILNYYDPVLRIRTFIDFLVAKKTLLQDLYDLPYVKQKNDEGRMYFFMHKELRNFVLDRIKEVAK